MDIFFLEDIIYQVQELSLSIDLLLCFWMDDFMQNKEVIYQSCELQLLSMLENVSDEVVKMATVSAVLNQAFEGFYWTGFYRMVDGELLVGPYQGTPACLKIAVGRGVCGTAVVERKSQCVEDVHEFPGHIACDTNSRSEVVIPVLRNGEVVAVLDIDSKEVAMFDLLDVSCLEDLIKKIF